MSPDQLQEIFTYHPPTEDKRRQYETIRSAAYDFARVLLENTPPSPDQTAAIRKIREAVMTANASIALDGMF